MSFRMTLDKITSKRRPDVRTLCPEGKFLFTLETTVFTQSDGLPDGDPDGLADGDADGMAVGPWRTRRTAKRIATRTAMGITTGTATRTRKRF